MITIDWYRGVSVAALAMFLTVGGISEANAISILSAVASDSSGLGAGINTGDTVTLTFDQPTIEPTIGFFNIDEVFLLNNGHTWLSGEPSLDISTGWLNNFTLLIVLDTTVAVPTVSVGDLIEPDGVTVQDSLGNAVSSTVTITGSFDSISTVPVPAAIWLFGTGLIGLVGFGRRRKAA